MVYNMNGSNNYIIVDLIKENNKKGRVSIVSLSNGEKIEITDKYTIVDDDDYLYLKFDTGMHLIRLDNVVGVFVIE